MLLAADPSMQGKFKGPPFAWKKWAGFYDPAEVRFSEFLYIFPPVNNNSFQNCKLERR